MKRYRFDHITTSGRGVLFWMPWGFWRWLSRVVVFALCLAVFILLFCLPREEEDVDENEDLQDGDVEITLQWSTADDLDLHCIGPDGEEIYYENKRSSSGGTLDKDMNVNGGRDGSRAVEHIYWPHHAAPSGDYMISVIFFRKHSVLSESDFTVRFKTEGCRFPMDTVIHETVSCEDTVKLIGTFRVE